MRIAVWRTVRRAAGAAVAAGTIAASAPLAAAEQGALYRWETADGTIAFTDDPRRVPERYRDDAKTIDRSMLTDYGRYTAADTETSRSQAQRREKRLAALRSANAADEAQAAHTPLAAPAPLAAAPGPVTRRIERRRRILRPDGTSYYRYYTDRTTVEAPGATLPIDPNDPSPVVTEKRRVRIPGQPLTQTITVTRQGDRVLSVTKPRSHYHALDFDEISKFE